MSHTSPALLSIVYLLFVIAAVGKDRFQSKEPTLYKRAAVILAVFLPFIFANIFDQSQVLISVGEQLASSYNGIALGRYCCATCLLLIAS
jgi:hypothetical protein